MYRVDRADIIDPSKISTALRNVINKDEAELSAPPPPEIIPISSTPMEEWDRMTRASNRVTMLSTRSDSFLSIIMDYGMTYNSKATLSYLSSRWKGIIDLFISRGTALHHQCQEQIESLHRNILDTKNQIGEITETSDESLRRLQVITDNLTKLFTNLKIMKRNTRRIYTTLSSLIETRCISKTKLFLKPPSDMVLESDTETITLASIWPSLFKSEMRTTDPNSFDDRKVFHEAVIQSPDRWRGFQVASTAHTAKRSIPSAWSFVEGINMRANLHASGGRKRYCFGVLLAALDSVATQLFMSEHEYTAWTSRIKDELVVFAPRAPRASPPPTPVNAVQIIMTEDSTEDDVDPITLEPFKEGDIVFKMMCCRNNILKTSIEGILRSGRTPKCPLCRTIFTI
jgi:hypothetical protein